MVSDVSVAFMHAATDEHIIVKPPSGIVTSKFWRLKKALNGTRRASQLWQEHSAQKLEELEWKRNDVNPCVFHHGRLDCHLEIHGDDFLVSGPRESIKEVDQQVKEAFKIKKSDILSPHPDDEKETTFLKRKISVDADGWHLELDERYSKDLIERSGVAEGKGVVTPGVKENGQGSKEEKKTVGAARHREYRGGAGVAQYMAEHRIDSCFATKELMRDASAPTEESFRRLKRVARYFRDRPRCVVDFPWRVGSPAPGNALRLDLYVDSDWADNKTDRKSTSGGLVLLSGHLLKQWSSTQATQSLSSAEAETKALTKGAIEGLYLKHLLEQQGFEVEIVIYTDASAALGAANRLGAGKRMKHLEIQDLWIQQLIRRKIVNVLKVSTRAKPADILTKHVGRAWLDEVCRMVNVRFPDERLGVGSPAPSGNKKDDEPNDENDDEYDDDADEEKATWNKQFVDYIDKYSKY